MIAVNENVLKLMVELLRFNHNTYDDWLLREILIAQIPVDRKPPGREISMEFKNVRKRKA